ncbi:MAG: hypothetical protein RMJ19_11040 [Gemmatales bacterium]|nr:hypothetical protein [Gemmatales bacterium]MDW8176198.1 hypothetical protein [Gemmatales bacterium]
MVRYGVSEEDGWQNGAATPLVIHISNRSFGFFAPSGSFAPALAYGESKPLETRLPFLLKYWGRSKVLALSHGLAGRGNPR